MKPGINYEVGEKKEVKNNVPAMRQKLAEMQTKLNWVERLDLVNGPAPLVPELAYKEELHSKERASRAKQAGGKLEEDVVHNDFTSSSSCGSWRCCKEGPSGIYQRFCTLNF